jgi:hypothetical protein
MEHALTLSLPEHLYQAVVTSAEKAGQTPTELISKILAEKINALEDDPLLRLAGTLSSDLKDIGARHDDYLGEAQLTQVRGREGG